MISCVKDGGQLFDPFGSVQAHKWSWTANDPWTGNDPQIGLQMFPSLEMVALSVMKEWKELKNLDSGFKLYILFIFFLIMQQSLCLNALHANFTTLKIKMQQLSATLQQSNKFSCKLFKICVHFYLLRLQRLKCVQIMWHSSFIK